MYPPMLDPALLRYQQIFGNQSVGNDMPQQGGFFGTGVQMPERLGQSEQLGGLPEVIDPSQIGSESIPEDENSYIARRLSELYQPQTTASERLNALLGQYPQRPKPNVWQKIGASLAGMAGGINEADKVLYGGHKRQVEDWENQVRPAEYLANQERYGNSNQRMMANQILTQEYNQRKLDQKKEYDDKNLKIREKRAAAYDFKQRNPNMQIKIDAAGNFVGINPQTGQMAYVTDSAGQKVSGQELSWEDKQNILQENAIARIDRQAEVGLDRIEAQGAETRKTKLAPSNVDERADDPKTQSASEQRTQRVLNAERALDEHPEWKDYIEFDGNRVSIKPPRTGRWGSGPDLATHQTIKNFIEGKAKPDRQKTIDIMKRNKNQEIRGTSGSMHSKTETVVHVPNKPKRMPNGTVIQRPDDRVMVLSPDGTTKASIPREQLERALGYGYKEIK